MKIQRIENKKIANIVSDTQIIKDVQSAVDMAISVCHETGYTKIALNKSAITEDFLI